MRRKAKVCIWCGATPGFCPSICPAYVPVDGIAFAWHTWHRIAGGDEVCSYALHEWYVVRPMEMWALMGLPREVVPWRYTTIDPCTACTRDISYDFCSESWWRYGVALHARLLAYEETWTIYNYFRLIHSRFPTPRELDYHRYMP